MKRETVYLDIQDIWPIALVFVITGIGVAFGLDVISSVSSGFTSGSYAANATDSAQQGINNITKKLPTIALVVVAAILIGVLIRNLAMKG
jgi:cell division protein FtsX